MIFFRPISYEEGDKRACKFDGAAAIREGTLCYTSGFDVNVFKVKKYDSGALKSNALASTNFTFQNAISRIADAYRFHPVYRENPETGSVGGTISVGDYCTYFTGHEFEIHESCTETGFASTWALNSLAVVGSTGKFTVLTKKNDTYYVVGYCVGTINGTWIRIRAINC